MHFYMQCIFRKTWWLGMLKTFKKEQISCRGGFKEIKASDVEKMHQNQTEIDKNTKKNQFLKILCSFCVLFGKPVGLEC